MKRNETHLPRVLPVWISTLDLTKVMGSLPSSLPYLCTAFLQDWSCQEDSRMTGEAQGSGGIASPLDASTDLHRFFILTRVNSEQQNVAQS